MILGLVDEAVTAGARQAKACEILGLDVRTVQRWREEGIGEDGRAGPKTPPKNKLSPREEQAILKVVNSEAYRDLSPKQIVPALADEERYLASESTVYRLLRREGQMAHRGPAQAPAHRHRPTAYVATGPNQVWSWDITYLKSPTRGLFYYLYLVVDVWSRKIVASVVHETESAEHASWLIDSACAAEGIERDGLVLHADNGSPMKGATMLATLEKLGIVASFSRPRVSDDNPYSEALFRTVKYRPEFPRGAFTSLEAARRWVDAFVAWYNTEHRHSAIAYVTPAQRHTGQDKEILRRRDELYTKAKAARPERWSGATRNWNPPAEVRLNPTPNEEERKAA
jgi:transposase InsO family protein